MRASPLDREHRALSARMTEFGGWSMPLHYPSGTIAEHLECRRKCVVFDVSHLGAVLVEGSGSFERLQFAFTNDLSKIAPGRAQYTHLLDTSGGVVDDIIVWWIDEETFLVIPNASNTERVRDAVGGIEVTSDRALIAVQGPDSRRRMEECWAGSWVPRFQVRSMMLGDATCTIAGTGYTGESGVEIHVPLEKAHAVWDRLMEVGIAPAGLGARDTLRLEAGLPLFGHELGPGISPVQADLAWVVAWDKGEFIGREAVMAEREVGPKRTLFGIVTDGRRPPRAEAEVFSRGRKVGVITSGNFSPVLEKGIALGFLDPDCALGDEVVVRVRDTELHGRIARCPFVEATRPSSQV